MGLLDGKVALITGAGRGIGRATAELFAREGARLVINDLDEEPAREAAQALKGTEVAVCAGSVTDPIFPDRWVRTALDRFGRIDILVNNAGYTWDAVVHKMTDEQWDGILDVHLKAPFRIIRAAAGYLREAAKAEAARGAVPCRKIINVSSTSGVAGNAGQANYAAAKMGIVGLTKTIAKEWGQFNITCNAVAYGFIDTRLTQDKEKGATAAGGVVVGIPKEQRDAVIQHIPLRRAGTPQDAAGPVLFLASSLSDYVTGAVILVTGGLYV
ncbi:MAG: SDR family oxidoreductase [Acidobacteria bacterium]|nr:SDR family oxidoreductase [Acidobacteriota bacterium]